MRAVRIGEVGPGVVEVPEPEPTPDEVVIEVVTSGVCGSDLHLLAFGPRPGTLGHEVGGLVDGRPVTFSPVVHCGACEPCRHGHTAICQVGANAVYGIHRTGGMAERVAVERSALVELPPGIDAELACLVEPVAVGLHGINAAEVVAGMRVAVVGAGTVGLVVGAVARLRGASVDIVARHPCQQQAAERLGLGRDLSGRYDVTVDAAGTASAVAQAVKACRPGGTVLISGTYWGDVTMPGMAIQLKELRILPVVYYGHHDGEREIEAAARALRDLPDLFDALVTHRFGLDDAAEAFRVAADKSSGAIKVVLQP
jgi:2-desacetyl-2-hydroxyethyl bacteriochlorophyllide A dehydrogenase